MSYIHHDLPKPGRFSLSKVCAARLGHARRKQKAAPRFFDGYPEFPEMAVYDPADDDQMRERMSPAEAWLLMVVYLLSACFVAWLLAVLAAFFGAVPQ